jgi:hypothetical protein
MASLKRYDESVVLTRVKYYGMCYFRGEIFFIGVLIGPC